MFNRAFSFQSYYPHRTTPISYAFYECVHPDVSKQRWNESVGTFTASGGENLCAFSLNDCLRLFRQLLTFGIINALYAAPDGFGLLWNLNHRPADGWEVLGSSPHVQRTHNTVTHSLSSHRRAHSSSRAPVFFPLFSVFLVYDHGLFSG